jgi:predicted phage-related endonuclease
MITYHKGEQGTAKWHNMRLGLLTASTVSQILTPTLKVSANDKSRALVAKLAAERITGIAEESIQTEKMLRGHIDEEVAREKYVKKYAAVDLCAFVTNDRFPLGFSPDGLVGDDGFIECKSRDPHHHVATIQRIADGDGIPREYVMQVQAGLLVTGREWCDFLSFSHGLPMLRHRVFPDYEIMQAIENAAHEFDRTVSEMVRTFHDMTADASAFTPTERIDYESMIL